MMRNVRRATRDAEAVLFLVDAGARPEDALPLLRPYCGRGLPVAVVLNKARCPGGGNREPPQPQGCRAGDLLLGHTGVPTSCVMLHP